MTRALMTRAALIAVLTLTAIEGALGLDEEGEA